MIGGIRETQEMLDFCAEHGLGAEIEVIPAEQDQRRLRARPGLRRPLPLRDRHRDPELGRRARNPEPRADVASRRARNPPDKTPCEEMTVEIQAKKAKRQGPAQMFTGDVWFDVIAAPQPEPSRMRVNAVHFAPCARTAWHSPRRRADPARHRRCRPGPGPRRRSHRDPPRRHHLTPPGEWHWHGAAPDHFMTHLAMWEAASRGRGVRVGRPRDRRGIQRRQVARPPGS